MAGDLRARLARARRLAAGSPTAESRVRAARSAGTGTGTSEDDQPFPEGWASIGGGVRFKETVSEPFMPRPSDLIRLSPFSRRHAGSAATALGTTFFDLETTGLSGGSGTVAFLAAFGTIRPDGKFSVRQYFMDDYPSEPPFLEALHREFSAMEAVVTYNGSSFDLPLYAVRRTMNGLSQLATPLHVDALHAARRLWRRTVGDCSLGSLERAILGMRREGDIPGGEVPEVWFEFVKRGGTARLESVFSHNAVDVRSLAKLFFLIEAAARGEAPAPLADTLGLAELQSRIDEALAERTLIEFLGQGDRRAVRPLMRIYRNQGRQEDRRALVPFLPDDPSGLYARSVYAERSVRDLTEAVRLAAMAGDAGNGALRERAERRVARLLAAISAREAAGSATGA